MKYSLKHISVYLLFLILISSCSTLNKNSDFSDKKNDSNLINSNNSALASLGWSTYINKQGEELKEKITTPEIRIKKDHDYLKIIIPGTLAFVTNDSTITPSFFDDLNSIISVLGQYSESEIVISGFTDNSGSKEHNEKISKERAESVSLYMERRGIDPNRISAFGYGSNPRYFITDNSTLENKALNRRIEILLLPPCDY